MPREREATPQIQRLAERLIAFDANESNMPKTKNPVRFHVIEKLHPHLATLMGSAGFHALLLRAIVVTRPQVSWLRAMQVKADGSLVGLEDLNGTVSRDEIAEGEVTLTAQLLALLATFVGEALMLQFIHDAWPKLPLNDFYHDHGENHEKSR